VRFYPPLDSVGIPLIAAGVLVLLVAETLRPLRRRVQSRMRRMAINSGVAAVALVVIRLALIPAVVAVAASGQAHRVGIAWRLPVPWWLRDAIAFLLIDYTMYLWHRANHVFPFLWRFHNVHHTDRDLDVTTAMRFHFGELLLSVFVRSAQVLIAGAGWVLALVYEIVLELETDFHHSNLKLPIRFERLLNRLIVTPRMHGIHHSIVKRETDSNFSNMLPLWDRFHRALRLNIPQHEITIGVPYYRDPRELGLVSLLVMPFRKQRRGWRLPDGSVPDRVEPPDASALVE